MSSRLYQRIRVSFEAREIHCTDKLATLRLLRIDLGLDMEQECVGSIGGVVVVAVVPTVEGGACTPELF